MAKLTKKQKEVASKVEKNKVYNLDEASALVKELNYAKFDASVDLAVRLGVDPRKANQMVRGVVSLPHGTGKDVKVLALVTPDKEAEAKEAGADYVGSEELVAKIQGGWTDFDVAVATPDMMGLVGRLGKILGPRGLMPNPKVGTVTMDVTRAVKESKAGKIEYRTDKSGNVQAPIGKASFTEEQLLQNYMTLADTLVKVKPAGAKGQYMKTITMSCTMGPGVKVDVLKANSDK